MSEVNEYTLVSEMNTAFGNPFGNLSKIDWTKIEKQCKNIKDETNELKKAVSELYNAYEDGKEPDHETLKELFKHIRDALCDIKVFAYGAFHLMGFNGTIIVEFPDELHQGRYSSVYLICKSDMQDTLDALSNLFFHLMKKIEELKQETCSVEKVIMNGDGLVKIFCQNLAEIIDIAHLQQLRLGVDPLQDMQSVIDGVMTRFCRDEEELQATIKHWHSKGITEVYVESEFPKKVVKSAKDQPDAPQGKFLKSVGYREAIFVDIL